MELLKTKLNPPRLQGDIVQRLDLIKLLDRERTKKLTLVCAPAGYGKSSVISEWLKSTSSPSAWLSLDEEDNLPRCFFKYLSAAIQNILPGENLQSTAIAEALELPTLQTFVATIVNDLEKISRPFCLVLDDFHFVKNRTIHELVNLLIKHQPRHMHLVLISREEPPLALSALRSRNEINELRIGDLRFSTEEVQSFLEKGLKQPIDLRMAQHWQVRTEGWVAGLQLALYASQKNAKDIFTSEDHEWNSFYVQQYLLSEVTAHQSPVERTFLQDISILERFEPSLCYAVWSTFGKDDLPTQDGHNLIHSLISKNPFIISLDETRQWFRFHHLMQEFLLKELSRHRTPEMIASLHARAAEWLAEHGDISQALKHTLQAQDLKGAVQLVLEERNSLLNQHRHYILAKWLSLFTSEFIEQQRELMMTQAWVYYYDGRYQLISPHLDKIESMGGALEDHDALEGEIALLRGVISYWIGEGKASWNFINRSLALLPEDLHFARGLGEFYLCLSELMIGEKTHTLAWIYDQMQNQSLHPFRRFRLHIGAIYVHLLAGELLDVLSLGEQYVRLIADWNLPNLKTQVFYLMGRACYQRNELSLAISYFSRADAISYNVSQNLHTDLLAGLALCYQASGDQKNALHHLDRLFEYVSSQTEPAPLKIVDSCRAHIELIATGATQWKGMRDSSSNTLALKPVWSNYLWIESPQITSCRALNALNRHEELILAEQKIGHLLELCTSHHNVEKQIELEALHAVVLLKLGHTSEAFVSLEKAVRLAEPGGYVRPFLESGPSMSSMLKQLKSNEFCADACKRLLAAFDDQDNQVEPSEKQTGQLLDWREVLSSREYEVLLCLEQSMHNQEIADSLYISKETVRFHLKNIYRKLQVSRRNQAVMSAKKIGLLP